MAEKFYWADEIANRIIKEKKNLVKGKKTYVCASGITPSGHIHIGNFREIITTELVVRALQDKKKKVRFIYSWDDFDRFRKVPKGFPKSHEKYIGMPVSEVPSLSGKGSYAQHFEKELEESVKKVGIKPEFIYQNVMNKKHKYAKLIKIVLDNKDKIVSILNKYRKEPLAKDWMPIAIYCEKCKKDFTKILKIKGYEIEYECKCGFKGKIDYRKQGLVSVKWRVDWPMRWLYEDVDFEPGGIDHSVHGGSFTTAKEIVKEVFNGKIPIYVFYDWVKIKGGQMFSSSSGNALTVDDVLKIYEPEVLRYLFVATKPKTGFQISFDNDVIKIYEDYDALEKKYYSKKANPQEKRIYELSQVSKKIPKKNPNKTRFRHLMTSIQTGKKIEAKDKIRAGCVKTWLASHAGEDMKFELQAKIKVNPKGDSKKALLMLRDSLKKKKHTEESLFSEFYSISKKLGISNKDFFKAAYNVILHKDRGPRLAALIIGSGQDKIIKLLNQIK